MVTSILAAALAGVIKLVAARSTAIRIEDLCMAIEALHKQTVQRNMNEIGEPTVKSAC
jgi:hypothetical protein